MIDSRRRILLLAATLSAVSACSKGAATRGTAAAAATGGAGAPGAAFADGGGDACDRYLTPDVVATILNGPAGKPKRLSAQSCSVSTTDEAGSITITLTNAGPGAFDAYQKYLTDPRPLPGVGDRAVQSFTGIAAVKGNDMNCDIDAGGAPGTLKITGAALGQALGAICNKIFAAAR